MDILCVMGLYPKDYQQEIAKQSKCNLQDAANKLQWAIVDGLDSIENVKVSIVNSPYIGSYPKHYKKASMPTFPFEHKPGAQDVNAGFCNIKVLKWFSRYFSIKKEVDAWAKKGGDEQKVLLVYALTIPFAQVVQYVNRKYKHIRTCVVVPDLPEYMSLGSMQSSALFRFAKAVEIRLIKYGIRKTKHFVLLTDAMKEWFGRPIKYIVVEGIAADLGDEALCETAEKQRTILYAGGINSAYGVVDLVKAFIEADRPDWQLTLYGAGAALTEIAQITADHPNVQLMGRVPNSVVVNAQKEVSVLVNPRRNQEFTRFSFPSKIMEYMSSGTPVLAYKLDGMPDDYDPYFYRIPEEEGGLTAALRDVMALTDEERGEMGRQARRFVAENKTPAKQCRKIVEFLSEKP